MLLALAQLNPVSGAPKKNSAVIRRFYKAAQAHGAELLICPEMALVGGLPQDLLRYSSFITETEKLIKQELAPLTVRSPTAMLIGACYRLQGNLYNTALLLKNGEIAAVYPKTFLENRVPFQEHCYFSPGRRSTFEQWDEFKVKVMVGDNARLPKNSASIPRACPEKKQLLINLVASPYFFGQQGQREKTAAALSKQKNSALLIVNLSGGCDEQVFDGASLAYNNQGELIYRAASFAEETVYLTSDQLFAPAPKKYPAASEDIATVQRALCLGIRDYFAKNGFHKALIGLSGGLDSAVTAALAAEALGPKNILGVLLPSEYSPSHSLKDALALADNLGMDTRVIPITPFFYAYLNKLNRSGKPEKDLAEENLQARIRGNILMFIANRERRLLLTTGNRSELAVGYCTLYGDMAGALAVLADLPKLTVYELARMINRRQGNPVIPKQTITKPPSAELRPDQLDEDTLPPYRILDPILNLYLDEMLSAKEIIKLGFEETTVKQITALVDRAEYKRRQAAPALRVLSGLRRRRTPLPRRYK